MKLSQNFTLEEMEFSNTAIEKCINNKANDEIIENLKSMCVNLLEALRSELKCSIRISSGYRCPALNKAVGGRENSKHTKGQAADIYVDIMSPLELYHFIKRNKDKFDYDQLIYERTRNKTWVHISYVSKEKNRKQDFIMEF
nr:D-Ala-D-Ala carboxypeptidase family metallohydrolase [Pigmentibacter ruber]